MIYNRIIHASCCARKRSARDFLQYSVGVKLMTGAAYLDSLRDERAVYLYGERVKNVVAHPAFRNAARSIGRLYDALHDPASQDLMTVVDKHGIRTHRFFAPSYSAAELLAARDAIAHWARLTYGFMGRTPDYKAAFMATLDANPEFYAPFEENARQWYRRFAAKALYLNHVLINPPVDRMKPVHETADVFLHVVRETDAGAIVSGAKMLATGSALTNATFVARSFAGDAKQVKELIKAAMAHNGIAVLDIISPCVTFNNADNAYHSYAWGKDHEEPLQEINFIPAFENISVEYDPGTTIEVEMHDGSKLRLRKLEEDYDPTNRIRAITRLNEAKEKGEMLTGVLYVNTKAPNFLDMLNITEEPLATLPASAVRPGPEVLRQVMEELS